MSMAKTRKNCSAFKAVDQDMGVSYRSTYSGNCKDCVYFSSRNCGMDAADSIEPTIDLLC